MKKIALITALSLLGSSSLVLLIPSVNKEKKINPISVSAVGNNTTIKIVNCADYIYIKDEEYGYTEPDLVDQFKEFVTTNEDSPFYGKNVEIVYTTSDTPETMYNEVKTGKTQIDLICPSDYMIQKMLGEDMLDIIDRDLVPNYQDYASKNISAYLDNIEAVNQSTNETLRLEDYCVGYMWGTLGILFNPTFDRYKMDIEGAEEMSEEELEEAKYEHIIKDMRHYNALWNKEYDGTVSIKNSIRDTLTVVDLKHHEEELLSYREQYLNGELTVAEYNKKIDEIFNIFSDPDRFTKEVRNEIYQELLALKRNIFGLEVDSGKNDIVTGKIGVNLAWSGDAVYAMDQAAEQDIELLYSVPEEGANIWFDGWVMPKNKGRSDDQRLLAHMFLDFISDPYNAYQNMDYIGYTSFIAGDDILELARDWYDYRTEEMYYYINEDDEDGYLLYVKEDDEYRELDYVDFETRGHVDALDDEKLAYYDDDENLVVLDDLTYGDLTIVDEDDTLFAVDLSYFFKDTLSDAYEDEDMIFYAEDYYVDADEDYPDGLAVGGQFYCQYPDEETINRCCIMQDFGENNKTILELWEDFKSGEFPMWAIVLLAVEVGAGLAIGIYLVSKRKISKKLRQQRKQNLQKQ